MSGKHRCFFPGGNTPEGFISYYDQIMSQRAAGRIFCIKGGPGTGKSTLMRSIGEHYLNKGENVEFLKCSSDPASLDGIVIKNRRVVVIDGTAPHVTDPLNPGIVDEIVDLARFIDESKLDNYRVQIIELTENISERFKAAYVYLKCAAGLYEYMDNVLKKKVDDYYVYDFIESISLTRGSKKKGKTRKLFGSAITSAGYVNEFKSLSNGTYDIYLIDAPIGYDTGYIIANISRKLTYFGHDVEELYCPMRPRYYPEHLISSDAGIAVFTCNDYHKKDIFDINEVTDIISIDYSDEHDRVIEIYDFMVEESCKNIDKAIGYLSEAKHMHDELEDYYIDAMDFDKVEMVKDEIIAKIDKIVIY